MRDSTSRCSSGSPLQGAAHDRPHPRPTAEKILFGAPDGTARNRVIEIAIDRRDPSLEPPDVIHQTAPNRAHRVLQPIPLGGQHVQPLAAARHQRVQLQAGVAILEYETTLLHHKTMVVDGVWSTIGTTNFDSRSFAHNEENNVCCYDRTVARRLLETFENDVAHCRRIDLDGWHRRGWFRTVQEVIAAFLQEQV